MTIKKTSSIVKLEDFGRIQLSKSFFMRDFLYSEIANWYGVPNFPDHPEKTIYTGTQLCEQLLEPLQEKFGRIAIRSAYRSPSVNQLGNEKGHNCASNEKNFASHIWDYPDAKGYGATACIVIPSFLELYEKDQSNWQQCLKYIIPDRMRNDVYVDMGAVDEDFFEDMPEWFVPVAKTYNEIMKEIDPDDRSVIVKFSW